MLYHFDYLTLLLAGAFDAQARLAHRVYGLTKPPLRQASFRRPRKGAFLFRDELAGARAQRLVDLVDDDEFQALLTLIYEPRNTIHDAALGYHQISGDESRNGDQRRTFQVAAFDDAPAGVETKTRVWEAAQRLGPLERWGIDAGWSPGQMRIDPWVYANQLVAVAIPTLNRLADAAEIPLRLAVDLAAVDKPWPAPHDEETRKGVQLLWGLTPAASVTV